MIQFGVHSVFLFNLFFMLPIVQRDFTVVCRCIFRLTLRVLPEGSATCWVNTALYNLNRKSFSPQLQFAQQSERSVRRPYVGLGSAGVIDFDRLLIC